HAHAMVYLHPSPADSLSSSASRVSSVSREGQEFNENVQSLPSSDPSRIDGSSVSDVPRDVLSRNAQHAKRMPSQLLPFPTIQAMPQGVHGTRRTSTDRDEFTLEWRERERRVGEESRRCS
ncbi:hypothetical protein PMAYCL1PPCAC_11964, partial [Pristionchus mayeri]